MNSYKDNDKEQPDDDRFDPLDSNTLRIIYGILILVMSYVSDTYNSFFGLLFGSVFMGVITFCAASMPWVVIFVIFNRYQDKLKWLGWLSYVGGIYIYYLFMFYD